MNLAKPSSQGELFLARLWQVALTYVRRWPFWVQMPILVAFVGICWIVPVSLVSRVIAPGLLAMQIGLITMAVSLNLRPQLDDWRSHLVPGFRLPHLLIGGAIIAAATLAVPWLVNIRFGLGALRLIAGAMCWSALLGWMMYEPLITVSIFISCVIVANDSLVMPYATQTSPSAVWAVLLISAAALVFLLIFLARLNGEGIGIARPSSYLGRPRTAALASTVRFGPFTSLLIRYGDPMVTALNRCTRINASPATPWARIRHRRLSLPTSRAGVAMMIGFVIFAAFLKWAGGDDYDRDPELPIVLPIIGLLASLTSLGLMWHRQWEFLPTESLRPSTRRDFVRETGMAMAIDQTLLYLWVMLAAGVSAVLLFPRDIPQSAGILAAITALSAAWQPLIFGVTLWVMRLRRPILSVIAVLGLLYGMFGVIALALSGSRFENVHATIVAIQVVPWLIGLPAAGAFITWDAYRRWCRTELG